MASGHIPHPITFDLTSNAAVPNVGDTVLIIAGMFTVSERWFDFESNPAEVILLRDPKDEITQPEELPTPHTIPTPVGMPTKWPPDLSRKLFHDDDK